MDTGMVQERYKLVCSLYKMANKEHAQIRSEMAQMRDGRELYDEYIAYHTLEDMYISSGQSSKLYEYHRKYLEVLKKVDESPYTLQDFEKIEMLKKEKARCMQNVKALRSEKQLLKEILGKSKTRGEKQSI